MRLAGWVGFDRCDDNQGWTDLPGTCRASGDERSPDEPATISAKEAADILGLSLNTVYRLAKSGQLAGASKVGRKWRIHRATLLASLAACTFSGKRRSR